MTFFKSVHQMRTFSEVKYFMKSNDYEFLNRYCILRKPYFVWKESYKPLPNLQEFLKPNFEYKQKENILIITKSTTDKYYDNQDFWKFNDYLYRKVTTDYET